LLSLAALPVLSQTCTYSLSPTSASFTNASSDSIVTVTASNSACPWTARSNSSWITISFGQSGTGNGSVGFTVTPNNTNVQRTGSLTIANITFNVTQAAAPCTYTLAPSTVTVPTGGGSGTINVTSICSWTAVSNNADWLTASGSGSASGVAQYVAAANTTSASRTGTITIGTATFTVTQSPTCTFTLNPFNLQADPTNGNTGTFTVTASANTCPWTAVSANTDWITVTTGASGTGNGTVGYTILPNRTTSARSGVISVGGTTSFNVYQPAGTSCTFALAPSSATYTSGGGASSFAITTTCPWTVTTTAAWINLGGPISGTGNGTVFYNVTANTSATTRTGSIIVGSQTFPVTQTGVACAVTVTPGAILADPGGSMGTIQVTAPDGCTYNATASASWITLGAASATGQASVGYSVAANTTPQMRTGTITIANQTIPVTQAATSCTLALTPTSANIPAAAASYTFHVNTNCNYTAVSSSGWLTISANGTGSGPADIGYAVAANTAADARAATITLGSQVFTVSQSGAGCTLTLTPTSADVAPGGGTGNVAVSATGNCRWQATADAGWIHVSYSAVNGNGTVVYTADATNQTSARSGHIAVADQTFTLRQAGVATQQISAAGVLNSASFVAGPVAPGEIVTIFGASLGVPGGATLQLSADQKTVTTTLSGTQVLFDGTPAPLIYAAPNQVSAIVPYALAGKTSTQLQVQYQGSASNAVTLIVSPSSPALFSLDASGSGPGAILNQDGTLNSSTNPAAKGSIVVLFATGEGQTNPAGTDGLLAIAPTLPKPVAPVTVMVGGTRATVLYAGAAPGLTAGVMQVNVQLPANVPTGAVPVVLQVGQTASPATVTVAVR
jgi:uncharacterized protein (TIGR03437 family)